MVQKVLTTLPYELTAAQKKAWDEISADLEMTRPMHRILQGDVGSGKTAIAALALAKTAASGYQGAIMAPTEILARQHFDTLNAYLQPAGFKVALLVGAMRSEARQQLLCDLADGKIDILVVPARCGGAQVYPVVLRQCLIRDGVQCVLLVFQKS